MTVAGPTFAAGYRDTDLLESRLGELQHLRKCELEGLPTALEEVYGARQARIAAGGVALAFVAASFLAAIGDHFSGYPTTASALLMAMAWPAYLLVRWLAPPLARLGFRRHFVSWLASRSYPQRDFARLEEQSVAAHAAQLVGASRSLAIGMPLLFLAFAGPLSVHLIAMLVMDYGLASYSSWMAVSLLIVGHAHIALGFCVRRYAKALWQPDAALDSTLRVWLIVVAVSAVPGILLFLLPPILTGVTGIVILPAMFGWARHTARREAKALDEPLNYALQS